MPHPCQTISINYRIQVNVVGKTSGRKPSCNTATTDNAAQKDCLGFYMIVPYPRLVGAFFYIVLADSPDALGRNIMVLLLIFA
jgi:hypothetical protein